MKAQKHLPEILLAGEDAGTLTPEGALYKPLYTVDLPV